MNKRTGPVEKDCDTEAQKQVTEQQTTALNKPPATYSLSRSSEEEKNGKDRAKVYGYVERQNFMIISILLASCCGCFNALTLVCSLPAVFASIRSHHATERGDHKRARYLGNISLTFMVLTLLLGAVLAVFFAAIAVGLGPLFGPCGFGLGKCTKDMFHRDMDTLTCIRWPL